MAAVLFMAGMAQAELIFTATLTTSQEPSINGPTTTTGAPRPTPFGFATFTLNDAQTQLLMDATIFNIDVRGAIVRANQPPGPPQTADTNDDLAAAHIHASATAFTPPATAGVVWGFFGNPFNDNAPNNVVVTPFASGVGGTFVGAWDLPEGNGTTLTAQIPNLIAGRSYVNFHTVQNPGGEIRGALQLVPEPSTTVLLGTGVLALLTLHRRRTRRP
jgi:hypothetical protein